MNQLDGSKFCHKICHVFGEDIVKKCQRYVALYNFQPLMADAYKIVFNFCSSIKIDRLFIEMYELLQDKAYKICFIRCRESVVEDCKDYVESKILNDSRKVVESYDAKKGATPKTYFTAVFERKVIDFCRSGQHKAKVDKELNVDLLIDPIISTEEKVIKEDLIEKIIECIQWLHDKGKLDRNERMIIKLMIENREFDEIATLLGIDIKEVYRIKDKAIVKITKECKGGSENE